jgi:hypothetical protein
LQGQTPEQPRAYGGIARRRSERTSEPLTLMARRIFTIVFLFVLGWVLLAALNVYAQATGRAAPPQLDILAALATDCCTCVNAVLLLSWKPAYRALLRGALARVAGALAAVVRWCRCRRRRPLRHAAVAPSVL